ncbi:hypothetical protein T439DRAFT_357683 [Meredithblackwellia eburnea MCA 4105]
MTDNEQKEVVEKTAQFVPWRKWDDHRSPITTSRKRSHGGFQTDLDDETEHEPSKKDAVSAASGNQVESKENGDPNWRLHALASAALGHLPRAPPPSHRRVEEKSLTKEGRKHLRRLQKCFPVARALFS